MLVVYFLGLVVLSANVFCYPHGDELFREKRSPQEPFEISSNVFGGSNQNNIPTEPPLDRRTTTQAFSIPTTENAVPGAATARTVCEQNCPRTSQFDPVCGTDGESYDNMAELRCAQRCGISVQFNYQGLCPTP